MEAEMHPVDPETGVPKPTKEVDSNHEVHLPFIGSWFHEISVAGAFIFPSAVMLLLNSKAFGEMPHEDALLGLQAILALLVLYAYSVRSGQKEHLSLAHAVEWAPCASMFVLMNTTHMLAMGYSTLATYVACRSTTPLWVSAAQFWLDGQRPSPISLMAICFVILGSYVYLWHNFNGISLNLLYSVANVAAATVYTVLVRREHQGWTGHGMSFWNFAWSLPLLGLRFMLSDPEEKSSSAFVLAALFRHPLKAGSLAVLGSCILACLVGVTALRAQKVMSAMSYNVLDTFSCILSISLGALLFADRWLPSMIVGLLLTVGGIVFYTVVETYGQRPATIPEITKTDLAPPTKAQVLKAVGFVLAALVVMVAMERLEATTDYGSSDPRQWTSDQALEWMHEVEFPPAALESFKGSDGATLFATREEVWAQFGLIDQFYTFHELVEDHDAEKAYRERGRHATSEDDQGDYTHDGHPDDRQDDHDDEHGLADYDDHGRRDGYDGQHDDDEEIYDDDDHHHHGAHPAGNGTGSNTTGLSTYYLDHDHDDEYYHDEPDAAHGEAGGNHTHGNRTRTRHGNPYADEDEDVDEEAYDDHDDDHHGDHDDDHHDDHGGGYDDHGDGDHDGDGDGDDNHDGRDDNYDPNDMTRDSNSTEVMDSPALDGNHGDHGDHGASDDHSRDHSGEASGDHSGDASGDHSGDVSGDHSGGVSGDHSGDHGADQQNANPGSDSASDTSSSEPAPPATAR